MKVYERKSTLGEVDQICFGNISEISVLSVRDIEGCNIKGRVIKRSYNNNICSNRDLDDELMTVAKNKESSNGE